MAAFNNKDDSEPGRRVEYTARPYQLDMYEMAKQRNTIACLGTGTGKTFIAILLMKDQQFAGQLRGHYPTEAKRTFFLVPTQVLVKQQSAEIKRHFDVPVKAYTGKMDVDSWDHDVWDRELKQNYVLVMTMQILVNMINKTHITFANINLMVIDEVHWASKKQGNKESGHTYKQLMNLYNECPVTDRPRILGLSASLINSSIKLHEFEGAIRDLEHTYQAVCNTSEVAQLCGTNPREIIFTFDNQATPLTLAGKSVVQALDIFISFLIKKKIQNNKEQDDGVSRHMTRIRKCYINVRNMLCNPCDMTDIDPTTKCMGSWCANKALYKYVNDISLYKNLYECNDPNLSNIFDCVITYMERLKLVFVPELVADPRAALTTASPKMHRLLEILRQFRPTGGPASESSLCGIIFVAQRSVAKVLAEWLQEIKLIAPIEYGFLSVGWVVGYSHRPGYESQVTSYTDKQQDQVLQDFRNKKLNLIVSTSVLEEGLDVRQCNLVVRFDRIHTFREYLQSKGRARAKDALYYMMTTFNDQYQFSQQIERFKKMENLIKKLNSKPRVNDNFATIDDHNDRSDDEEVFRSPIGARVSTQTAIALIYKYCNKLPSDSFTKFCPIFTLTGVTQPFQCTIKLPANSGLNEEITGKLRNTKKGARANAAFEVCKKLYKLGKLDESFSPIGEKIFIERYVKQLDLTTNPDEDVLTKGPKPGTRNRTQIYPKRIARVFTRPDNRSDKYFMHRIAIKYPQINCFGDNYLQFAAITGRPIANRCSFPVYVKVRHQSSSDREISPKVSVDFGTIDEIVLNGQQILDQHYLRVWL